MTFKLAQNDMYVIEDAIALITPPEIWALTKPDFPCEPSFSVQASGVHHFNFSGKACRNLSDCANRAPTVWLITNLPMKFRHQ